ncbi:hypothetical protein I316_04741 [Kwoniella heveanensis BCC8398]|uniref:Uncharacterized protein n=1 Tax=Kwoniella heveanensis BCC8398 TaxID=1296120 RepID=A0A1B9GRP9_9TREE|nr:hypothetical protein I316_04741 [Kwoniella heveanensis BCC8398]
MPNDPFNTNLHMRRSQPYHDASQPQLPTGPPPRYTAVVTKVYPYSLRPVVFFTAFIGFIYGIALGVAAIKDMGDDFETAKQKVFDIVTAILYFVIGAIEAYALFVAFVQKIPLARFLVWLVPAGIIVNLANQVIAVIIHFTMKNDLINQCVKNEVGELGVDGLGNVSSITTDQAQSICDNAWDRGTWSVFAWLFLSLIVSLLFGSILMSYYRQLIDPSSVRTRNNNHAQNQAFQMQPGYYYPPPPPPNNGSQPWMVPPYPGPPATGAPPPGGFEKSDYHPDAPWAQGEYSAPRGGADNIGGSHRAEEEAWQRAQSEGVTAHLTGHATSPRQGTAGGRDEDRGYVVRNDEEDEAWERARTGGVTAHLTGHAPDTLSNEERRREGAI